MCFLYFAEEDGGIAFYSLGGGAILEVRRGEFVRSVVFSFWASIPL